MKIFTSKATIGIIFSFLILLISLVVTYYNITNTSMMLKKLDRTQVRLTFYTNSLNNAVRQAQIDIESKIIQKYYNISFLQSKSDSGVKYMNQYLKKLLKYAQEDKELSKDIKDVIFELEDEFALYATIRNNFLKTMDLQDFDEYSEKLLPLIIKFNAESENFIELTDKLMQVINATLYDKLYKLNRKNKSSSKVLIFSFVLATVILIFSIYKYNMLTIQIKKQLQRALDAELDLEKVQAKLIAYNENLEEEISKKAEELHDKIYNHFLTKLPNRNKLLEDFNNYRFIKIAILNIDKFQSFNDVYGENMGNIALKMTAQFLKDELPESGLYLYHIGGDEFAITCSENRYMSDKEFVEKIEYILDRFKHKAFSYQDKTFSFMMSAGVTFSGKEKMLAYADMALKKAKRKNVQISIFDKDKELATIHKDDIECHKKLVNAIETHNIISYYQPIVPIQDNSLPKKFESLVRLNNNGTIIPPFNFLKVAIANRLYEQITKIVVKNTLKTIEKYRVPCSLNISMLDIEDPATTKFLFNTLENYEYNHLLTIELLETENFENYEDVLEFCLELKKLGVKIALDDFGSGYSNFSHILKFPIHYIKIDATLISDIDRNDHSKVMVETIVALAKKLNVYTIAEFVASREILDTIKEVGVDYAQGYYLGKPAPIDELS